MRKKTILWLIVFIVIVVLSICTFQDKLNVNEFLTTDIVSNKIEKIDINQYKYINSIANFDCNFEDGYVYFFDKDYLETEEYTGKVRWNDEDSKSKIVNVYQVISSNGQEIYNNQLKIIDCTSESSSKWDYYAIYEPLVKAKCDIGVQTECYIKLLDDNNVEYRVMLTPNDRFNVNGYFGSSIYVIDKLNNVEFWYDDLIK